MGSLNGAESEGVGARQRNSDAPMHVGPFRVRPAPWAVISKGGMLAACLALLVFIADPGIRP